MNVFVSYSHADAGMPERLRAHCAVLLREGRIGLWHDREIEAGAPFDQEIVRQLKASTHFVPLVSPDYLSSRYCESRELRAAIKLHRAGELAIVPVILEPCDWRSSPLGRHKALPQDGKPVRLWRSRNAALLNVVMEFRRLVQGR
ncbi:MAG: toll/interleukin-1 receptor domain-containing protein [Gammaproteobacteria bacterium]